MSHKYLFCFLRYDHHQKTFTDSVSSLIPGKPFVTKLSSAGLIYVHFGKKLIAQLIGKPETDVLTEKIVSSIKLTFFFKKKENIYAQI